MLDKPSFLRNVLFADAAVSGVAAGLVIFGSGLLAPLLELPRELLVGAGLVLVPYVALVAWVATRKVISKPSVKLTVALNVLWAITSVAILLTGLVSPNTLGTAFIAVQAAAVALLGELQLIALKRRLLAA
jgi:hypothetical protein